MFSVTVRDHVMIAHSLHGEVFGPAQELHGATYAVGTTFRAVEPGADGIVVDIGRAGQLLHETLAVLNYQNLDELPEFAAVNSTTEVVARWICERLADRILEGALGAEVAAPGSLTVTLHESPAASASYERPL